MDGWRTDVGYPEDRDDAEEKLLDSGAVETDDAEQADATAE